MSTEALNQRFLYIPRPALYASLLLHGLVLVALVTNAILDHFNIHLFQRKPVKELYQDYIQVDVVALPQNLVKDMPKTDATLPIVDKPATVKEEVEKEKPAPPPPDTMQLQNEKTKKEQEAARKAEEAKEKKAAEDARKKKEAEENAQKAKAAKAKKEAEQAREKALKKLEDQAKREAALKALSEKKGKAGRAKIAGNMLSKGTAATGKIGDVRDRYYALVVQKIREHFNIYNWQQKKALVAVVHIELFPTGRVRSKKILKRSSDPLYDSAVLQSIEEAQPLPVPEDPSVLDGGLDFEFRPQ